MNQIGRRIIHLESVDSTNNYTANLIKEGKLSHGTVILADEQFAGKGQRGAEWLVEPGKNLTFSVFWEGVNMSVDEQFKITEFISLVLIDTLASFQIEAKIKWPNDIYVGDRKIAGILIENQLRGGQLSSTIIGVGLNINQEEFGHLPATSIFIETGVRHNINDVLFGVLEKINERSGNGLSLVKDLHEEYIDNLYLLDQKSEFESQESDRFTASIINVDRDGKLVLNVDGKEKRFDLKEIRFIIRNA